MGGSEGTAGADPEVGVPSGVVHDITMPKLGETVTEGTIGRWLKQVGDTVEFDDPLFEVSTDKVDSEIPSPHDGVMLEILVGEGETVPVGTVLARIGEPGATRRPAAPSATRGERRRGSRLPPHRPPRRTAGAPAAADRNGRMLSPLVRRLVAESGLDVGAITGYRRGRPDPARGRGAGDRRGHGPGAGTCRRRPGTCGGSGGPGRSRARARPRPRPRVRPRPRLPRPPMAATRS